MSIYGCWVCDDDYPYCKCPGGCFEATDRLKDEPEQVGLPLGEMNEREG